MPDVDLFYLCTRMLRYAHPLVKVAFLLILTLSGMCPAYAADDRNTAAKEGSPFSAPAKLDDAAKRKYFTDLKLVTQEGKEVRFYSDILKDKVVLLSFFYTNCKIISPKQNMVLGRLQAKLGEHLGKDVSIVSITVDPARDTPEKVKEYAAVWAAKKGWLFLTGKKGSVDWVNYKLGEYTDDVESHPLIYILANVKTGHWLKLRQDASAESLHSQLLALLEENGHTGQEK